MTCPSIADAKLIERFLRTQHFGHAATPKNYAGTLRTFASFIAKHSRATTAPTVPIMQQWLKERSRKWPAHILHHRACLVERYLTWLHTQGEIASNPFAELHRQYGPRTSPIIRALVSKDSTTLEQLRQLPPFGSCLGPVMEEHVAHMRTLGYRYDTEEELLLRFDRYLQRHPALSGLALSSLVEHWHEEQPSASRLYEARKAGRIVSKAMHRLDPLAPVLPIGDGVARAARQHHRAAHLYTDEEVRRILQAALAYPSPKAPWRPVSLFTMLMLAFCAGLRGGEIARLRLGDVDLRQETIAIQETKFFKSRCLPVAPGVMAALRHYLSVRESVGAPTNPDSALFWSPQRNCGYSVGGIRIVLTDVLRRAGVKPVRGAVGARIHDLRHTMVGHRMRDCYKSGINPQSKLPYLATYLGHKDIRSTLVYLNITPELLQQAGERFRKNGVAALRTAEDSR